MGIVHSKPWSRLHPGRVCKIVLISEDIACKWPHPIHESWKQKFRDAELSSTEQAGEIDHDLELEEATTTLFTSVTDDLHCEAEEIARHDPESSQALHQLPGGYLETIVRDFYSVICLTTQQGLLYSITQLSFGELVNRV